MKNHTRQVRRQMARSQTGHLPVAGFTPVASQRLANLVSRKLLQIAMEIAGKPPHILRTLGLPTNMAEAQEEAQRRAVRDLPVAPMVRSHRIKRSKSDSRSYRYPNRGDLDLA